MELKLDKNELNVLTNAVKKLISRVPKSNRALRRFEVRARYREEAIRSPAELLIAASLVNQTRYQSVVVPRLKQFRRQHRNVKSFGQLQRLLNSKSDFYIYTQILHFGSGRSPQNYRAPLLRGLTRAFIEYGRNVKSHRSNNTTDYGVLRVWAREPNPFLVLQQANGRKIPGLGPKLIDWLRMFGGDFPTVPNDVYTVRGMRKLGLGDTGQTAAFVARLFGLSPYALDVAFRP